MKGTITKKANGRYYVATHQKDGSGKFRQVAHGGYRTKKEAEAALREVLTHLDRGSYVEPSKMTVEQYLSKEWLPSLRNTVRPSTEDSYRRNVTLHVLPHLGQVLLQQLTAGRLNALYADLLDHGRQDGPGGLAPKTVRYIHTTLHKALKDALNDNLVSVNVAAKAKPPTPRATKAREMLTWTAPELRRFLDHVRDNRLYAAWVVAASTGMRRGEVLGLRWTDVDLDAARVSVSQALISVAYEVQFSDTKTSRGTRMVDLDAATVAALRSHRAHQAAEGLAWGPAYTDNGLVFTREDGTPIHPDGFTQTFQRHAGNAKLTRIRLHDLRHTHATPRSTGWRPSEGHERAARTRQRGLHHGPLRPRHPSHAGRSGTPDSGTGLGHPELEISRRIGPAVPVAEIEPVDEPAWRLPA